MHDADIRAQLEEERHIIEAATDGPWFVDEVGDFGSRTASIQGILRERYGKNAMSCGEDFDTAAFIAYARSALPVRNAQIEAVLELHRPETFGNTLGTSQRCTVDEWRWPCPTVTAIEEAGK